MGMSYSDIPLLLMWLCQFELEDAVDTGEEKWYMSINVSHTCEP